MVHFRKRGAGAGPVGAGGRVVGTLFLLAFCVVGAFVFYFLLNDVLLSLRSYSWRVVPCEIVSSQVEERLDENAPYVCGVRYEYLWNGQEHVSERVALKPRRYSDYGQAQRLVNRFPAGAKATCRVNPGQPTEAILLRESLWSGVFLVVPLAFVFFGAVGLYLLWRSGSALDSAAGEKRPVPLSEQATSTGSRGCLAIFCLIFFLVGATVFYGLFLRPVWRVLSAGDWVETPCVIESSRVRSHSGDESTTYSVDILYRYDFREREYKSSRYQFPSGSSSGYEAKAAIVRAYPVGRETVCYVNPRDPTEAVLYRGGSSDLWLGLIPLVFVVAGAGGLVFSLRRSRPGKLFRETGEGSLKGVGRGRLGADLGMDGPVVLQPRAARWARLLGMIFIALFWNGIVSVFVWQVIKAWQGRGGSSWLEKWFLPIFLIPFVLVGLGLIGAVFHSFLGLFSPQVRLRASTGRVRPGETLQVEWHLEGRVHLLQRLRIYLEGIEEATYRRGTDTRTDKAVFATLDLVDTTNGAEFRSGRAQVTLPPDTVPTFEAPHNKLLWVLRVRGEIRHWPDIAEEYPLQVLPPAVAPPTGL